METIDKTIMDNFIIKIIDKYIKSLSSNWWIVFLTGLIAILIGFAFIVYPTEALMVFSYFLGILILIIGLAYIFSSFKVKRIEKKYEKLKEDIKSKFN